MKGIQTAFEFAIEKVVCTISDTHTLPDGRPREFRSDQGRRRTLFDHVNMKDDHLRSVLQLLNTSLHGKPVENQSAASY